MSVLVLAPLRIEARALAPGLGEGASLQRSGMGPRRARAAPFVVPTCSWS